MTLTGPPSWSELGTKIHERSAEVLIVGGGYVGLPLAVQCARNSYHTTVCDIDEKKIRSIREGRSYIGDVSSADLADQVGRGWLRAVGPADRNEAMGAADIVIICVPTPLNKMKDPDVSMVMDAVGYLVGAGAPEWRGPKLVILESTVYPGFTREVLGSELQRSLTLDQDFFLAFSPERIDPGNPRYNIANTPKLVGGATEQSGHLALRFYESIISKAHGVSCCEAAEMAKILENTFRMVNIGLANEAALICRALGLDVWEVIDAAATKPFGFTPFRPGPGTGGHCLASHEWVYFKNESGIFIDTMENFWNRHWSEERAIDAGCEACSGDGTYVLGTDGVRCAWEPVSMIFRRQFSGTMVSITTTCGHKLDVTARHPMLRVTPKGELVESEARLLLSGDRLPVFTHETTDGIAPADIDMIAYLPMELARKTRVRAKSISWRDKKEVIYRRCPNSAKYDYVSENYLPLTVFLDMEPDLGVSRSDLLLLTGRGASFNSIPAVFRVDEAFARLIGYYLSEGCVTKDGSLRTRFTFGAHEEEYEKDLAAILDGLGIKWSRYVQQNSLHIKVSSDIFGFLMKTILECGVDCYSKKAPEMLLAAGASLRQQLLCGLVRGDGSVEASTGLRSYTKNGRRYCHQNNSASVSFFSSSEALARQVGYLFQSLGIVAHFSRRKTQFGLLVQAHGAHDMRRCLEFLPGGKGMRIKRVLARKLRCPRSRTSERGNGGCFVKVKEVEMYPVENQAVFSLETEKTHTFAAGSGILVHNCIPVDPHYLSWKLKTLNHHSRLIEVASRVNAGMPAHVVALVTEALNRRQRALKESHVLVLGVSYKPDVGDLRESPALDVMMMLWRQGAKVSYYDPHVPVLKLHDRNHHGHFTSVPEDCLCRAAEESDCVVIITDHAGVPYREVCRAAPAIVDARNATKEFRGLFAHKITLL